MKTRFQSLLFKFVCRYLLSAIKVETQRGFVPVNEKMQVLDKAGAPVHVDSP